MTQPKPYDAQCTDCRVDQPPEDFIYAGGVLCGGCGRKRGAVGYVREEASKHDAVTIKDLSLLVRRLCRYLNRSTVPSDHPMSSNAMDYLKRKGLMGSPLRKDEGTE